MKKLKNKLILVFISFLLLLFAFQSYSTDLYSSNNFESQVFLIEWKWQLISWEEKLILSKYDRVILEAWDIVRTITPTSLAVIEWWDWSITRIWWRSEVLINENFVSNDLSDIQIDFDLVKWKTWSNVKSIIWNRSFFQQKINNRVASVRWTVFWVSTENDYIEVLDHKVSLENLDTNEIVDLFSWDVFILSKFEWISFAQFESEIKDIIWEDLNNNLDIEYLKSLKTDIQSNLEKNNPLLAILEIFFPEYRILYELDKWWDFELIYSLLDSLSEEELENIRKNTLYNYQKLNFVKAWDELFELKMNYKDLLTKLSTEEDNIIYTNYSLFDIKDAIDENNKEALESISTYLSNNSSYIDENLLNDVLWPISDKIALNEDLLNILKDNFNSFWEIFNFDEIDVNWLIDSSKNLKEWIESKIHEWLDKLFNNLK